MSTALTEQAPPRPPLAVATQRARIMAEALVEEAEQRKLLGMYVAHHMIDGTDYGVIPGTKTPTLLKPGAEKLTDLFRCTPEYELVEKIEDWTAGLFHYLFRVKVVSRDTGVVFAEGFGSANSREGRYRWRNASRRCPECGKEAIIKGKAEYGGGWLCFKKKDGCGAKFEDGDESIEGQEQGRVENDDIYTLVNTILKMAKKRALVDGAIALARCSDIFTQDLDDLPAEEAPRQQPAKQEPPASEPAKKDFAPPQLLDDLRKWMKAAGMDLTNAAHFARFEEIVGRRVDPGAPITCLTAAEAVKVIAVAEAAYHKKQAQAEKAKPAVTPTAPVTPPPPDDDEDSGGEWPEEQTPAPVTDWAAQPIDEKLVKLIIDLWHTSKLNLTWKQVRAEHLPPCGIPADTAHMTELTQRQGEALHARLQKVLADKEAAKKRGSKGAA